MSNPGDHGALVELVDSAGRAIGALGKLDAHLPPGRLHHAISVFLLNRSDRLLVQRRAAGNYHSAGLWSNTCCGHPSPGERPSAAASRRLVRELRLLVAPDDLVAAGTVVYEVGDPASGLIEREYDHVFVGRTADQTVGGSNSSGRARTTGPRRSTVAPATMTCAALAHRQSPGDVTSSSMSVARMRRRGW